MNLIGISDTTNSANVIIAGIEEMYDDGSFLTQCQGLKSSEHYTVKSHPNQYRRYIVRPISKFKYFERTKTPKDGDILRISYYLGHDIKRINKIINDKTLIVEEKLPIYCNVARTVKGNFNAILGYIGLDHVPSPNPRYEDEMYTKIELTDECKYEYYTEYLN